MTDDADFKRLVRQRMRDAGESYVQARTALRPPAATEGATLPRLEFSWDPSEREGFVAALSARPTVHLHDGVLRIEVGDVFRLTVPRRLITGAYRPADLPPDAPLGIRGQDRCWFTGDRHDNLVTLELAEPVRAQIDLERAAATDGSGPGGRLVGWAVGLLTRFSRELFLVEQLTVAVDQPEALLAQLAPSPS